MNYQIGGNSSQTGLDSLFFGNTGQGVNSGGNGSVLGGSRIGDMLTCRLVKNGKEPVLDINGIQIKTKASAELDAAQPGDTIYLKIQEADTRQVSLKIVGVKAQGETANMGMAVSTQVQQTTEQYSEMIKDNLDGAQEEDKAEEEILQNLSPDEIAKLRMMQIDVTNASFSDLIGMVVTIRSVEHEEEINEQLGDIVRETLGKLRSSLMGGGIVENPDEVQVDMKVESGEEWSPEDWEELEELALGMTETEPGSRSEGENRAEQSEPVQGSRKTDYRAGSSRLNSEGYVVKVQERQEPEPVKEERLKVSDNQLVYLVQNNMNLTIGNLETAKNSVNTGIAAKELPLNQQVWEDIYPQVTGIIEAGGMSVTEQTLSGAKFMLTHELPITVDSLRLYMSVQSMNRRGIQEPQVRDNINEQIAMGNPPEEARISGSTIREKAQQLMEKVHAITTRAIDTAVSEGKPLTISYLYNSSVRSANTRRSPVKAGVEGASLSLSGLSPEGAQTAAVSMNPQVLSARRQIEEIRLGMTAEAATRLVRQDINIDARPISQVIDLLRIQENEYYENMVSAQELHDIPDGVDLLKETLKETDNLKNLPAYALGEVVKYPSITVGGVHDTATRMKIALAGSAYEVMLTKPRRDMGDSIQEAFRNVDDILMDMNLDRNEENQRAVRILAYNEMELTMEHIFSVKSVDAKVQQMFETLTPQIVLNLIRENKNPLNMTIDGLNEEIMQQREIRGVTDEQRFSEFLYQMEQSDSISEEERAGFVGIYRLLDKVQKSHGKDIGALVRNGQEVTLNNLFRVGKSRKVAGMDLRIDDDFGEMVNSPDGGILAQIQTAYNRTLANSMLRHMKPQTLKDLSDMDYANMSFEELDALIRQGDNGQSQEALDEKIMQDLKQALQYEEQVEMMLEANDMEKTVTNILAAHEVMYGEDGIFGMIREIKGSLPKNRRDRILRQERSMLEHLDSKEDVMYGLEHIRAALSEEVHAKEQDGTVTALDIQSLKYLNAGMPIAMRAVEQDVFQIPLVVEDQVSIMKVSILRDGSNAGEITATMNTGRYGALEAYVHVVADYVEGYIVTESEEGQRILEDNELTMRSVLAKVGVEVKDLRLDGSRPVQYEEAQKEEVPVSKLYKVAKQLLTAVKLMGIVSDK